MLKVLGLNEENQWRRTVLSFDNHDVYYLPQYTKAFHLHGDGEPMLFSYESANTRAINVVMKRDIAAAPFAESLPGGTYFDLSTPYGYGGFLLEGDCSEAAVSRLNTEYSEYCRESGIVSEFVRFHPLLKNHAPLASMYEVVEMGKTVYLDLSSPQIIHANIHPKTHNRIKKAQRECLGVYNGNTEALYAQFFEMYTETMARNRAHTYYFFSAEFFDCVRREMPDNAVIFYTLCHGQVAAMELVLYGNHRMHSHLQASKKEFQHFSPVPLLLYQEALWGCSNGMREFHLGGGLGCSHDNIYQFKSNFNQYADTIFFTGRKVFDREKYNRLLEWRQNAPVAPRPGFFPQYRA